ncbi:hypothetical protein CK203_029678 [Vitis vinifera]|uniref:Uncharacterized protein n=1 Tax=Vitis vinifera TaxID=29760 RepID=A0A438II50_VITVI|nr:hypothetical protein CK203_029678 [Vitis vinifera]
MPNVMLVVSAEMRNIALLQPQASSDDTTINYFFQTSGQEIHVDIFGLEYRNVIDGEEVTITNLEAKFVPRG